MTARRSLSTQSLLVVAANGFAQVATMLVYAPAARAMGPESFGTVVTAIATAIALMVALDFGTNAYWLRELARNPEKLAEVANRSFTKISIGFIFSAVAAIAILVLDLPWVWAIATWVGLATLTSQSVAVFVRADHRNERVAYALVSQRVFESVAVFTGLYLGVPAQTLLPTTLLAGALLGTLMVWFLTPRVRRPHLRNLKLSGNPWRGSLNFATANAASSLAGFDTAVVQAVAGPGAAGAWAAVNRWTQPMATISNSVTTSAAPYFSSAASGRDAVDILRRSAWLLFVASGLSISVILAADAIVSLVLGDQFGDSVPVLQLMAAGTAVAVWNQPLAVLLQSRGLDGKVAVIRLGATLLYLAGIAVISPILGAQGAAIAYIALQVVIGTSLAAVGIRAARPRQVKTSNAEPLSEI